jgi:hypothetical protein
MKGDRQQLLRVLRAELAFLESGGYWSVSLPSWRAPLIFEDSPTCLRYSRPQETSPCSQCVLAPLVPVDKMASRFPCRHIPLNEQGETLNSLYGEGIQEKVESAVARWLRAKIGELEGWDAPLKAKSASI